MRDLTNNERKLLRSRFIRSDLLAKNIVIYLASSFVIFILAIGIASIFLGDNWPLILIVLFLLFVAGIITTYRYTLKTYTFSNKAYTVTGQIQINNYSQSTFLHFITLSAFSPDWDYLIKHEREFTVSEYLFRTTQMNQAYRDYFSSLKNDDTVSVEFTPNSNFVWEIVKVA